MQHPLIAFYAGTGTDHRGRTFNGILSFSNTELETCHDYLQWLFPLCDPSPYSPDAPTVTEEVLQAFRTNEVLQQRMHQAFLCIMDFYGLVVRQSPQGIEVLHPEDVHSLHWFTANNHNFRRLARIMASLKLLGLECQAASLWQCLQQLALKNSSMISTATLTHWRFAAMGIHNSV